MLRSHRTLLYAAVGQIGWFVCVLSAARGAPWIGMVFVAMLLAGHLSQAPLPMRELRLAGWIVLAAIPWETTLVRAGLITYPYGTLWPGIVPPWLLALWVLFAIQLNVLFRWLRGRLWLAAALGAIAGPLSFRAGVALGAAHFPNVPAAMAAIAAGWAVWMPSLVWLAQRSDGIDTPSRR
ncbi:MAG: DUF2878 domain-containing protein [Burkholderiaceae bacterium]|nr:DUF2878 domain-containing protein [Burkholderiaceae bacterium]